MTEQFALTEYIFESKKLIKQFISTVKDILEKYPFITVADVCDLLDVKDPVYDLSKIGWTSFDEVKIVKVKLGYKLTGLSEPKNVR